MTVTVTQIETVLKSIYDSFLEKNLIDAKLIKNIVVNAGCVSLDLHLPYPSQTHLNQIKNNITQTIQNLDPRLALQINASVVVESHAVQMGLKPLPGVKNILVVASGKGGVGKSTTAVNLALALVSEGASVGLLDADIYGPSQPMMLGLSGQPDIINGELIDPLIGHGLQVMSIGFLIEQDTPMVWRGPMVTRALDQLLNQTRWKDLDYLVVDMPPGTGDIQLSLAQKVPVTGAIIVTTPQDIALLDAKKGLKMFEKVGVPILGIVENMAIYQCSQCGHQEHVFGSGGGEHMASTFQVPYLGGLPLDIKIREQTDAGVPTVVSSPESAVAQLYRSIAIKAAAGIAKQAKNHTLKFPKIVVQNT